MIGNACELQVELASIETLIDGELEIFVSATIDGQFAGILAIRRFGPEMGISNLYVIPDRRRQGIASKLLQEAERIARNRAPRVRSLILGVKRANRAAKALYEACGFTDIGEGAMRKWL